MEPGAVPEFQFVSREQWPWRKCFGRGYSIALDPAETPSHPNHALLRLQPQSLPDFPNPELATLPERCLVPGQMSAEESGCAGTNQFGVSWAVGRCPPRSAFLQVSPISPSILPLSEVPGERWSLPPSSGEKGGLPESVLSAGRFGHHPSVWGFHDVSGATETLVGGKEGREK